MLAGANKASLKIYWQLLIFSKSTIAAFGHLGLAPKMQQVLVAIVDFEKINNGGFGGHFGRQPKMQIPFVSFILGTAQNERHSISYRCFTRPA